MKQGYGRRGSAVDSQVEALVKHVSVGSFVLIDVRYVLNSKCQLPLRVRVGRTNNIKVQLLVQFDGSLWHAKTSYGSDRVKISSVGINS